jgi:hypothetical protein
MSVDLFIDFLRQFPDFIDRIGDANEFAQNTGIRREFVRHLILNLIDDYAAGQESAVMT